jgi:hypothetical protein
MGFVKYYKQINDMQPILNEIVKPMKDAHNYSH